MVELTADWLVVLLEVGWCGAAAWWWKLEADADLVLVAGLVLLPGDGNWKLIFPMSKCLQCKYPMSKMLMSKD